MAISIEDPISQRQRCTAIPAVLASRGEGCSRFRELAGIQPGIVDGDQAHGSVQPGRPPGMGAHNGSIWRPCGSNYRGLPTRP